MRPAPTREPEEGPFSCDTTTFDDDDDGIGSGPYVAAPTSSRAFRNASSSARVFLEAKDHLYAVLMVAGIEAELMVPS